MAITLPVKSAQVVVPAVSIPRGSTIRARNITYSNAGGQLEITSARFSISAGGCVIYTQLCTFGGGVVQLPEIPSSETENWPDLVTWGVKINRVGQVAREYVIGSYTLTATPQPKKATLP